MQFQYSAGAIIYKEEGGKRLFLILERGKRSDARKGGGNKFSVSLETDKKYDIAKGHIEKGETAEVAARREIKEESGLNPTFIPFFNSTSKYFFFENGKKIFKTLKLFIAESGAERVKISSEHAGYMWVEADELVKLLGHKNMIQPLKKIFEYIEKWEAMKLLNVEYSKLPEKYKSEWKGLSSRQVPGEGRLDARIMFVGQAPGANEDIQLRPFIGRSGELLNRIMRSAGIKRDKVYITSVVQFFPEKNRIPTPREIEICRPLLQRQIAIIKPSVIVLLGNVSASTVLGIGTVETNHGKIISKDGAKYLITYHPAAALRFGKNIALMEKDLAQLKGL